MTNSGSNAEPAEPAGPSRAKRSRISQTDIPSMSLERALRVPRGLADNYASQASRPLDVASALDMGPSSGTFRSLCGAAVGYGLTDGGPNAPLISLTSLGARIVTPTEVGDDEAALRDAALKPTVANQFYTKYDGSPLPPKTIAQNVLAGFEVPRDRTGDVYDLLLENARHAGFLKRIKEKEYIDIGGGTPPAVARVVNGGDGNDAAEREPEASTDEGHAGLEPATVVAAPSPSHPTGPSRKNAIFVGYGGSGRSMEQLVKILDEYGIPHKRATEEANRARPIPQKVAETMQECGAAILIFTGDREYFDAEGNSVWRPSENVSHELGAASVLYGERIVVFKEKGIDLPSNFSSVGYIEFEKDKLGDKGIDLFRELVGMKILTIAVG